MAHVSVGRHGKTAVLGLVNIRYHYVDPGVLYENIPDEERLKVAQKLDEAALSASCSNDQSYQADSPLYFQVGYPVYVPGPDYVDDACDEMRARILADWQRMSYELTVFSLVGDPDWRDYEFGGRVAIVPDRVEPVIDALRDAYARLFSAEVWDSDHASVAFDVEDAYPFS